MISRSQQHRKLTSATILFRAMKTCPSHRDNAYTGPSTARSMTASRASRSRIAMPIYRRGRRITCYDKRATASWETMPRIRHEKSCK